ncbi:hypothetical protein OB905_09255 [Halobacteria archaeon AArc-dxtr1]|nr:hypothetical protein [Halobacteria archaeon AArc-dxtr1]
MKRRHYLSVMGVAGVSALAGCSTLDEAGDDSDSGDDEDGVQNESEDDESDEGTGDEGGDEHGEEEKSENGEDEESENGDGEEDESENGDGNGDENGGEAEPTELVSIQSVADRYDPNATTLGTYGRSTTIDGVEFDDGLAVMIFDHGVGNEFAFSVLDADGREVGEAGPFFGDVEGASAVLATAGIHSVTVETDISGNSYWTLATAQPNAPAEAIHEIPVEASGTEPDVMGPVEIDGTVTVAASYEGNGPFELVCYDEAGTEPDDATVVFEEEGPFEGETEVEFDATAWIGVEAVGDWSFEIQ